MRILFVGLLTAGIVVRVQSAYAEETLQDRITAVNDKEMARVSAVLDDDVLVNDKLSNAALTAKVKKKIQSELKDPDSAKFDSVKVITVKGTRVVCGQLNAKNSFGAFTGPQPFVSDGEKLNIPFDNVDVWHIYMSLAAGTLANSIPHPALHDLCE